MIKLGFFCLFLWATLSANAGSITLDTRIDHLSKGYNQAAGLGTQGVFRFSPLRLDLKNSYSPEIDFRLRIRLDKEFPAPNAVDNTHGGVDYAYIQHQLATDTWVTAGKLATEIGGYEVTASSADRYLSSEAYSGRDLKGNTLLGFGFSAFKYATGVKVKRTLSPNFELTLALTDRPRFLSEAANSQMLYGTTLKYKNQKSWGARASYFVEPSQAQDKSHYLSSLGVSYEEGDHRVTLDFAQILKQQIAFTESLSSTVIIWRKHLNQKWNFLAKAHSSDARLGSAQAGENFIGAEMGAEYYPKADDKSFRYHLVVNTLSQVGERTTLGIEQQAWRSQEIILGLRLEADFLNK